MTFKIKQKEIAAITAAPAKLPKANNTVQAAECLRLIFTESGVSVSAMDFECWLTRETLDNKGKQQFCALVPARSFYSLLSALPPDGEITFSATPKKLTIKTKSSVYNFGSLPLDEWPEMKAPEKVTKAVLSAKQLTEAIGFSIVSVCLDENRYYMNGIHISEVTGGLRFASTDGHRASHYLLAGVKKIGLPERGIIIPHKTVRNLLELLSDADGDAEVEFCASESTCSFRKEGEGNFHLRSKLIDGQFPDVDRVIPYDREHVDIVIPRAEVISAMNRLAIVGDQKTRGLVLEFSGDTLSLRSHTEKDDGDENITIGDVGKGFSTGANSRLLISLLEACPSNDIHLLNDEKHSIDAVIAITESLPLSKQSKAFSIIMPMRG